MNATVFLDVIMVTLLLVGAGLASFLLWLRKKDKELFEYIEYLELEKEELTGQINCLKHEINDQRRRFNATVHFMNE